jgi:hypothetical protein
MSQPTFKPIPKDELEPGFHVKSRADVHECIVEHVAEVAALSAPTRSASTIIR